MKTALAIGAHPDDIEFIMAGTMIHLRNAGYELHYLTVANGSCGSNRYDAQTLVRMRRQEAMAAAASLGAVFHDSVCNDLEIFYTLPLLAKVAAVVRQAAPEIVLTHAPSDYMEDHMNACRLAITAAFVRGMPNFQTDPPCAPVDSQVTVYHAQPHGNRDPLGQIVRPEIYVDTTRVIDQKLEALSKHESQRGWLGDSQQLDSYLQALRDLGAEVGRMSGRFEFAEGWRRHLHLGFCGAADDPLVEALKGNVLLAGGSNERG
jgi:LmbE family N-acetylglucosaminyl deacetylase